MIYSVCPQRERSVQTTEPSPWIKLRAQQADFILNLIF